MLLGLLLLWLQVVLVVLGLLVLQLMLLLLLLLWLQAVLVVLGLLVLELGLGLLGLGLGLLLPLWTCPLSRRARARSVLLRAR